MIKVTTNAETAVFEVEGWDKVWSLTGRLVIPLEHIESVEADTKPAMGWFQGLKVAGTELPNVFRAGLFYQDHNLVFWDVHNPENTVVIKLHDERYGKLVIEVDDPEFVVSLLTLAIAEAAEKS